MPACGDSLIMTGEECDDGNKDSNDGCSSSCRREPGYSCSGTPSICKRAVCGNGLKEAGEGCDDSNNLPFDGCSPNCQVEPVCGTRDAQGVPTSAVGKCATSCGDGILLRGQEDCDDGNTLSGDGCSSDCHTEDGFTCSSAYDSPPTRLSIPIVYRDFQGYSTGSNPPTGHPDFGHYCCNEQKGIVSPLLDANRKPVYAGTDAAPIGMTTGKTAFSQWYRDVSGVNQTFYASLTLFQTGTTSTTYAMNSDVDEPWHARCGFYPIEDSPVSIIDKNNANYGKTNVYCYTGNNPYSTDPPSCPTTDVNNPNRICYAGAGWGFGNDWASHNYGFTSELRYWFQYQGGEVLTFTGDDDVWVFVNGSLAVDLGGVHNRAVGQVTLDKRNGTGQVGYGESPSSTTSLDFKLELGGVYEVVVFQAERWCCGSNYMLTLANFLAGRSSCTPTCGNGIATAGEECDNAASNCKVSSTNRCYDQCTTDCKYGPFCGDAEVNGAEECDDGRNTTVGYGVHGCGPGCKLPPQCGDGVVQPGEECDEKANNVSSQCGGCGATCQRNPTCGDTSVDTACGEQCDDGLNAGGYGFCGVGCKLGARCGDSITQTDQGEECDDGTGNSDASNATCTTSCRKPGFCGDGILQKSRGELCDDGKNDGSCGGCTPDCQRGPYCGDGVMQKGCGEVCDYGDANSPLDGAVYGGCLVNCQLGPHCGDGVVQRPDEQCDLGADNGDNSNECSASCMQKVRIF
jgi:fibro-slime domain-containing protein